MAYPFFRGGITLGSGTDAYRVDRHILDGAPSDRFKAPAISRVGILSQLLTMPLSVIHPEWGRFEWDMAPFIESGPYDASVGGGEGDLPLFTYTQIAEDGQTSPYVYDGSGGPSFSPPPGWVLSDPSLGMYGWSWSIGSWPSGSWLTLVYHRTTTTGSDVPYRLFVRFLLLDIGTADLTQLGCGLPAWWPELYARSPSDAAAALLSLVSVWRSSSSSLSSVAFSWLEDSLGLDLSVPRLTIQATYQVDGRTKYFLFQLPQAAENKLPLILQAADATYPCMDECLPGFDVVVTALSAIAASLVDGDDTVAKLLRDIKKTAECAATTELAIRAEKGGLYFSSTTGVSGDPP